MNIIVTQNCVIAMDALKALSFGDVEGHLIAEYQDGTSSEVVFNNQAEAKQALTDFIKSNTVAAEWKAECIAPTYEQEEENV